MDPIQVRYWTLVGLWFIGVVLFFGSVNGLCLWTAHYLTRSEKVTTVFGVLITIVWLWCCVAATPEINVVFRAIKM